MRTFNEEMIKTVLIFSSGLKSSDIDGDIASGLIAETIRIAVYSMTSDLKSPANQTALFNWVVRKLRSLIPNIEEKYRNILRDGLLNLENVGELLEAKGGYYPSCPCVLKRDDETFFMISGIPTKVLLEHGYAVKMDGLKRYIDERTASLKKIPNVNPEDYFMMTQRIKAILDGVGRKEDNINSFEFLKIGQDRNEWVKLLDESSCKKENGKEQYIVRDQNDYYIMIRSRVPYPIFCGFDPKLNRKMFTQGHQTLYRIEDFSIDDVIFEFSHTVGKTHPIKCVDGEIKIPRTPRLPRDAFLALNLFGDYVGQSTFKIDQKRKTHLNKAMNLYNVGVE